MDQRISSQGKVFGAVLTLFCGVIMAPVAIGLLASYPHELWPLGLLLSACSAFVIYQSFRNFRKGKQQMQETDRITGELNRKALSGTKASADHTAMQADVNKTSSNTPEQVSGEIFQVWTCTSSEWNAFLNWEKKDRKQTAWVTFFVITVLGTFFLMLQRDAIWWHGALVSAAVGAVFGILSVKFSLASVRNSLSGIGGELVITSGAVLINNHLNIFQDDTRSLSGVTILESMEPKVMKIEYRFITSGGFQDDEIHFPIPKGKLGDAVRLMNALNMRVKTS